MAGSPAPIPGAVGKAANRPPPSTLGAAFPQTMAVSMMPQASMMQQSMPGPLHSQVAPQKMTPAEARVHLEKLRQRFVKLGGQLRRLVQEEAKRDKGPIQQQQLQLHAEMTPQSMMIAAYAGAETPMPAAQPLPALMDSTGVAMEVEAPPAAGAPDVADAPAAEMALALVPSGGEGA
eukprot:CAMPEP_0176084848 /NCGR_PEP_ID=MMETSP0120_2-20121206/42463_1 /TAXON_ID=160619 /ORGANISM="Kryptoperidinium foliaceum, Strain CCMP 1326" /LENGTH=176 /DNA_ID=CAMNT_0017418659 /DNA_START=18 /DNA_END=545 /DNA_ORIENTATION=-